jgi:subtilisin family serine protease
MGVQGMKRLISFTGVLMALLWATPAKADTRVIVRTTGGVAALNALCNIPTVCTVVGGAIDGTLSEVFLITTPLPLANLLPSLQGLTGFVAAEADQVLNLVDLTSLVPSPIPSTLLSDRMLVAYPANSATMVWNSYATQSAASIVEVQQAQSTFNVTGTGVVVADIDTGVDPNHPALQGALLQGYDFTRNQAGGSELNDLSPCPFTSTTSCSPPPCTSATCPSPAKVNQSSAAILDQSSAAILDGNTQYAAFGHGTMVMGIIHLVAPTAQLLPLKAFKSDGTANLSDILRAIYYAVQQGNASVINMSFDTKTASAELKNALDYANQLGVVSAASAGNDGMGPTFLVYPAALQNDVMGVASVGSTTSTDAMRSSFSNFGTSIVWVAAPGESIISTYPFNTYGAGWGTSFSAPFVSGGAALLRSRQSTINEAGAAAAIANAAPLTDTTLGHGRLDLVPALQFVTPGSGPPDFTISAAPSSTTITAGQTANYTVSTTPTNGFNQTVTWSCTGAPTAASCSVSPMSMMLDGTHAANATVTVTTTARGMLPPAAPVRNAPPSIPWMVATRLALLLACAWLLVWATPHRLGLAPRQRPGLAAAAALIAVALCTYSCGGGYSNSPGPPGSPTLYSVTLNPTSVNGGSPSTGTVTLSGPAPNGATVSLSSSNSAAAAVPATVTVPAGSTSATFTVTTSSVTSSTPVTISASYAGANQTASLTVTPVPPSGTPAGTYTLTVTGTSGSISHPSTFKLSVN